MVLPVTHLMTSPTPMGQTPRFLLRVISLQQVNASIELGLTKVEAKVLASRTIKNNGSKRSQKTLEKILMKIKSN